MHIEAILRDHSFACRILRLLLDPTGLAQFKFKEDKMGLGEDRLRIGFIRALDCFRDSEPSNRDYDRQILDLLKEVPPTLSPSAVIPKDVFEIATKFKYKLSKSLGDSGRVVPTIYPIELLLDSVSYGCHMADRSIRMSYRDHYVHPVVVAALGVHVLLWDHHHPALLRHVTETLWDRPDGRRLLERCADGKKEDLEADLGLHAVSADRAELRRQAYVLLVWILAASYHDIGRHILTMAQVQASNTATRGSTRLPAFSSYVARSCFSRREEPLKCCARHYPRERHIAEFRRFARSVCHSGYSILCDRLLQGGMGQGLKGMGTKGTKDVDHAFVSSLEIFIWALLVHQEMRRRPVHRRRGLFALTVAFRLASAAVLIHHLGAKANTREALFGVTMERNPLGALLRLIDYFQSACRPYLANPKWGEVPAKATWPLPYEISFDLSETTNAIFLEPNSNPGPLAFTFHIKSRLKEALDRATEGDNWKKNRSSRSRYMDQQVREFVNEGKTLQRWLRQIGTGAELDIWHENEKKV